MERLGLSDASRDAAVRVVCGERFTRLGPTLPCLAHTHRRLLQPLITQLLGQAMRAEQTETGCLPTVKTAHIRCMVTLAVDGQGEQNEACPETLLCDRERVLEARKMAKSAAVTTVALMVCTSFATVLRDDTGMWWSWARTRVNMRGLTAIITLQRLLPSW